jgi:hypothetical protein
LNQPGGDDDALGRSLHELDEHHVDVVDTQGAELLEVKALDRRELGRYASELGLVRARMPLR